MQGDVGGTGDWGCKGMRGYQDALEVQGVAQRSLGGGGLQVGGCWGVQKGLRGAGEHRCASPHAVGSHTALQTPPAPQDLAFAKVPPVPIKGGCGEQTMLL